MENQVPTTPATPSPTTDIPLAESFKTKLIALWFVISCLISVLVAIATVFVAALTAEQNVLPDGMMKPTLILYAATSVTFLFLATVAYKISAAIHRMEMQAYHSAKLLFIFNIAGSVLGLVLAFVLKVGWGGILISPLSIVFNAVLLLLLAQERPLFLREGKKSLWWMTLIATGMLILNTSASIYLQRLTAQRAGEELKKLSQDMEQRQKDVRAQINAEPDVTVWTKYRNDSFHFQLDTPDGWMVKEYQPNLSTGDTTTIIAFGLPGTLSEDRTMGINKAHSYVRIASTADEKEYRYYQTRMADIGKYGTLPATLGGERGVDNTLSVAAEHEGYIYEFTWKQKIDENDRYYMSPISKKMMESFAFIEPELKPEATASATPEVTPGG